jgi:hypothetical protein
LNSGCKSIVVRLGQVQTASWRLSRDLPIRLGSTRNLPDRHRPSPGNLPPLTRTAKVTSLSVTISISDIVIGPNFFQAKNLARFWWFSVFWDRFWPILGSKRAKSGKWGGAATPRMVIFQGELELGTKNRSFLPKKRILMPRRHCSRSETMR